MISWISTFASDLAYYFIANFVKIPKDTHILAFRFNSSLKLLIFYVFFCYCNKGRVSFNWRPNFICSYFLSATQNCLLKPCYFMPANFIDQLFYDLSCFLVSGLNHYLLRLPFPNIILKLLVRITSSRVLMWFCRLNMLLCIFFNLLGNIWRACFILICHDNNFTFLGRFNFSDQWVKQGVWLVNPVLLLFSQLITLILWQRLPRFHVVWVFHHFSNRNLNLLFLFFLRLLCRFFIQDSYSSFFQLNDRLWFFAPKISLLPYARLPISLILCVVLNI